MWNENFAKETGTWRIHPDIIIAERTPNILIIFSNGQGRKGNPA